ncbi:MAG: ATP-dependent zinc metalloprotease FtsH [Candidatus Pacebacteria bacterium]|nr:ATP-dependent zinc metalloprotease FtsH [Candidatus Paceibacterota bacterium]
MKEKKNNKIWKNIIYVFLGLLLLAALFSLFNFSKKVEEVGVNALAGQIEKGEVKKMEVVGDRVNIELKDGKKEFAIRDTSAPMEEVLKNYGVDNIELKGIEIVYRSQGDSNTWLFVIISIVPFILIIFFFWWMFRQGQQGATQAFSFGRSKAREYGGSGKIRERVTFRDVADLEEAKQELQEIVEFLKTPKKFLDMGARIPRGVLLVGPPGCGKTLLARAVAAEAGVPFFSISGSEFVEMFVGVGASRVRDLFANARKNQPSIIFVDELDAVGRHRGAGLGGGHDEREQTLNQILVEMDGFEREATCIVMAATNRPDILDPALLRPGRFDRHVILDEPDIKGRQEILKIHTKDKPLEKNIDLREIAERTSGFSGADIANLVNEAAILAARKNKKEINQEDLRESIEKVLLGPERKSHILSEKEKEIAAFHEAGHALVSAFMPDSEPVHKISIVSRGMAAGYTLKLPSRDKYLKTKTEFVSELATLLGGYETEKMIFNEITTGASNDLRKSTDLARKLVMEYGMSRLGPVTFGKKESMVFLGKEITEQRNFSEEVAEKIDKEVERLINEAEKDASRVLAERKHLLEKIAKRLIKEETIERKEFEEIIGINIQPAKKQK